MKNVQKVLFYILLSLVSVGAQANQIPYLAIAGPGEGAGMMGHAFIVFANQKGQFLDAEAYQYGIRFPDDFKFSMAQALQLSQFPFIITKLPAWSFIKNYSSEGRYVHLFELNLSAQQITTLQSSIEEDMVFRESLGVFDYSVQSNNCITKLYDELNKVISNDDHKFVYSSPTTAPFTLSFLRPKIVAATVPLAAAANLPSHPLVTDIIKFRSGDMHDLETNLVGIGYLDGLLQKCSVSPEAQKIIRDIYGNKTLRQSDAYLKLISDLFSSCTSSQSETKDDFNFHLDFLKYQSSDRGFIDLVDQYYLY